MKKMVGIEKSALKERNQNQSLVCKIEAWFVVILSVLLNVSSKDLEVQNRHCVSRYGPIQFLE